MTQRSSVILPITLIVAGVLILLFQWDIMEFSRPIIFILIFSFLSIIFGHKASMTENKKGIASAVFFGSMAVIFLLMYLYVLPVSNESGLAAIFLSLALGQFANFGFNRSHIVSLVFGIVYALIAVPLVLMELNTIDGWYVFNKFELFWPVALILIGIGFFLEGYLRRAK